MFNKVKEFVKSHPKLSTSAATLIASAAAYYGGPAARDLAIEVLKAIFG